MKRLALILGALALTSALVPARAASEQGGAWPAWRGPAQTGATPARDLPTEWGPEKNVAWKTELPYWSGSTPILWGDRIFLTTPGNVDPEVVKKHEADQKKRGGPMLRMGGGRHPGGDELLVLCLSAADGKVLWQKHLDSGNKLFLKSNNTSPSPVTDGDTVWVTMGTGQITALDFDGNERWQRDLEEDYGTFGLQWGYASSPLLYEGLLIVEVLHGTKTDEPSYLLALDGESGETVWLVERPTDARMESPDAYTTPLLYEYQGIVQVVISGGDCVTGHDPETGEELWRVNGLNPNKAPNYRIVASPLAVDDMIIAPTRVRPLTAIQVDAEVMPGDGDIAWQWSERGGPDVPTPTTDGELYYMIDDSGIATALDVRTGEKVWGPQRTVQGTVSSSPILADGKIYFTNEESVTVVLKAGREFEMLAANELDGSYALCSPIAVNGRLYVRTGTHLYCIAEG